MSHGLGRTLRSLLVIGCIGGFTLPVNAFAAEPKRNPAVIAVPLDDWMGHHRSFVARAAEGDVDLLFIGDSITAGWGKRGLPVWNKYYAGMKAANFGIGGDSTQNVLWRLQNGELDGIAPKVVVLMVGTNNLAKNSVDQIVAGITADVEEIRHRSPTSLVLLLGLLPRDQAPNTPRRKKIAAVNKAIARLDDGKRCFFLDIGDQFLSPDQTLDKSVMPDYLHPSAAGYQIWADAMAPVLTRLLDLAAEP